MFFYQVIMALLLFQLCMLALLGLKIAVVPAILVVPLPFLTILFMFFCSAIFTRPFQVLSLRAAVDLDEYRQVRLHPHPNPTARRNPFQVLSLRAAVDLDEYRQVCAHSHPKPTRCQPRTFLRVT